MRPAGRTREAVRRRKGVLDKVHCKRVSPMLAKEVNRPNYKFEANSILQILRFNNYGLLGFISQPNLQKSCLLTEDNHTSIFLRRIENQKTPKPEIIKGNVAGNGTLETSVGVNVKLSHPSPPKSVIPYIRMDVTWANDARLTKFGAENIPQY